jgi:hypothetical protein
VRVLRPGRAAGARGVRGERLGVVGGDERARHLDRLVRHAHRVGAVVGDEPRLEQRLRGVHRLLGAHAQLAAGVLLQRRGGVRRRRPALGAPRLHVAHDVRVGARRGEQRSASSRVANWRGTRRPFRSRRRSALRVALLRLGGRGGVGLRLRGDERHQPLGVRRLERPVGAGDEGEDLALALAEDVQRRRLAAPGRLRAGGPADLLRAVEADDAVEHAPRPLRVHARRVDRARPRHGGADRRGRDLAELDAHRVALPAPADLELPGEVPGDRLPLAVGVGGEEHPVEPAAGDGLAQLLTTFASRTTYDSSSVARSTP